MNSGPTSVPKDQSQSWGKHMREPEYANTAVEDLFDFEAMSASTFTSPENNHQGCTDDDQFGGHDFSHNRNQGPDYGYDANSYQSYRRSPNQNRSRSRNSNHAWGYDHGHGLKYSGNTAVDTASVFGPVQNGATTAGSGFGFGSHFELAYDQTLSPTRASVYDQSEFGLTLNPVLTLGDLSGYESSTGFGGGGGNGEDDYFVPSSVFGMSSELDIAINELDISRGLNGDEGESERNVNPKASMKEEKHEDVREWGANNFPRHAQRHPDAVYDKYPMNLDTDMDFDEENDDFEEEAEVRTEIRHPTVRPTEAGERQHNDDNDDDQRREATAPEQTITHSDPVEDEDSPQQADLAPPFAPFASIRHYQSLDALTMSSSHLSNSNHRSRDFEYASYASNHDLIGPSKENERHYEGEIPAQLLPTDHHRQPSSMHHSNPKLYAPQPLKSASSDMASKLPDTASAVDTVDDQQRPRSSDHRSFGSTGGSSDFRHQRRQSTAGLTTSSQSQNHQAHLQRLRKQKSLMIQTKPLGSPLASPPPVFSPPSPVKDFAEAYGVGIGIGSKIGHINSSSKENDKSTPAKSSSAAVLSSPTRKKPASSRMLRNVASMANLSDFPDPVAPKMKEQRLLHFTNYSTTNMPSKAISKRPSRKDLKKKRSSPLKQMRAVEIPIDQSESKTSNEQFGTTVRDNSMPNLSSDHQQHYQQQTNFLDMNPFENNSPIKNSPVRELASMNTMPPDFDTSFDFSTPSYPPRPPHVHSQSHSTATSHFTDSDTGDFSDLAAPLHHDLNWTVSQEVPHWRD